MCFAISYAIDSKSLTSQLSDLETELSYYRTSVAIVPSDSSGTFHRYGCEYLNLSSSYNFYHISLAFQKGLNPCPHCFTDGFYIGNTYSHIFHSPTCLTLPSRTNRIYFLTISEAKSEGYSACHNCKPVNPSPYASESSEFQNHFSSNSPTSITNSPVPTETKGSTVTNPNSNHGYYVGDIIFSILSCGIPILFISFLLINSVIEKCRTKKKK